MKYVLVKEGEYRPNIFSELTETVNAHQRKQIGFFTRIDYSLRLVRNTTDSSDQMPLGIAHFHADPKALVPSPTLFRPIDTELMFRALSTFDYVLFGVISDTHLVKDIGLLGQARYIGRNYGGSLVDVETGIVINPDSDDVTFMTCFFGMVRAKDLPVYYLIMDPKLLHATSGFDYDHKPTETFFKLISDHDGTARQAVFCPLIFGARQYGDTLLATDNVTCVELDFFQYHSVLSDENPKQLLESVSYYVYTNAKYELNDAGTFVISITDQLISFFEIKFNLGPFFNVANELERPEFKYLIINPAAQK